MSLSINGLVLERADGVRLLGPLSLNLAPGDRLGLVGESGSGKSLLARAVFGALPKGVIHAGGTIRAYGSGLDGAGTRGGLAWGRRLAWMPQDPLSALSPMLTLGEHLTLLPGLHRKEAPAAALARLTPLLDRLHLPNDRDFLDRFPHQVSGGQRQRICLAMALSCDPDLLVLDEPTTALDSLVQRDFLDLMLDLQRERGLGYLWITHDLAVASRVCNRLLVLYGGEPMEAGPARSLLSAPRHPYTARLLEAARHQPSLESGFLSAPQDRPEGCPFQPRCLRRRVTCATWGPWRSAPAFVPEFDHLDDGFRCESPLAYPDCGAYASPASSP
ncbi:MAG TPA: ABC transporter ATP-binding protein [Geothrix sp.]|nr:ABC transporter ATP-binding protein [Geothrix sp.]